MPTKPFALALALSFAASFASWGATYSITVANGDLPRTNAIIHLPPHPKIRYNNWLKGPGGGFPIQANATNGIAFVIPSLKPGETVTYTGGDDSRPLLQPIKVSEAGESVAFNFNDRPLLVYQGKETQLPRPEIKPLFKRGGYLHPVYSPSGRVVTDDYPPNHIHHHGIWMPWTKTEFEGRAPDFWNMGDGKGKVEFAGLKKYWPGAVSGGLLTEHRFIDLTSGRPKAALNETWAVTAYGILPGQIPANVFDLESVQTTATDSPLKLPKYYYGGLGFRGNWAWNGAAKTFFLAADGTTNRLAGNEKQSNWCYIGGEIDGQQTGVAILCHPKNFRAPQPMRWHPTEPFFCYAPSQLGDWEIKPGDRYTSKYHFIVFDGKPNREWIENMWQNYANPPEAKVVVK